MKKVVFLFLALLLPILIYFFLKTFGKNEFDVPVLYTDSVPAPAACKAYVYHAPYVIADSILRNVSWDRNSLFTVFVFEDGSKTAQHERSIHIKRVLTEFDGEPVNVIRIFRDSLNLTQEESDKRIHNVVGSEADMQPIICAFLLSSANDAVIIDQQKRIRGQYRLTKREDADRMIMEEMNILLKRY